MSVISSDPMVHSSAAISALLAGRLTPVHESAPEGASHWSADSVIYQIYPRSFRDSNGDGMGDLPASHWN